METLNTPSATAKLPLAGLRILELGHIVAGPSAGQIFADLGADVLKVESVAGGDQIRNAPGPSAGVFHFLNRNKRSIALDLKGAGKDVFMKLAAKADVILDNFAYGVVDRLGIGYDVIAKTNPAIIWLAIKGFVPGPAEARPLLDELAQMMGGLAFMTGPAGQPMRAGASVIDVGAATYGVVGVLAALRQRDATGQGQLITAGLYETSVYWVGQWMAIAQLGGEPSVPMPVMRQGQRMGWGVYRLFETADGEELFIGITSNPQWDRFCAEFGLDDLHDDPKFCDNQTRVRNRNELAERIGSFVKTLKSDDAQRRLEAADVPFAPLWRPDQLVDDPQLQGAEQLVETPMPDGTTAQLPKIPIKSDGIDMSLRSGAPKLGEHTVEVLTDLGYSQSDIDRLVAEGAVAMFQDD